MKIVISGSASCGKTSIINELFKRGFNICEDTPRKILIERANYLALRPEIELRQNKIFQLQLIKEKQCSTKEITFFDYGIIEIISYTEHLLKKKINFPSDISSRYDIIFLLDRLPWIKDDIRIESNAQEAEEIHELIKENYKRFGYKPIPVPVLPVKKRVDFILEKLE